MVSKKKIYGLVDPRSREVFYVGKTKKDISGRLREHLEDWEGTSPKQRYIKEVNESGKGSIDIVLLEKDIDSDKRAFTREIFWIELFAMSGAKLTNAAVEYKGTYFLADYHVDGKTTFELETEEDTEEKLTKLLHTPNAGVNSRADLTVKLTSENIIVKTKRPNIGVQYFCFEECETITLVTPKKCDFVIEPNQVRNDNRERGKKLNYHMPLTIEEVSLINEKFDEGTKMDELVEFFQRPVSTLKSILKDKLKSIKF